MDNMVSCLPQHLLRLPMEDFEYAKNSKHGQRSSYVRKSPTVPGLTGNAMAFVLPSVCGLAAEHRAVLI